MMKLDFQKMWTWHPANRGIISPCMTNGKINFENQCAIRMSECFSKIGISTASFNGARCYPDHHHNQSHILRAEELAKWMKNMQHVFGEVDIKRNVSSSLYKDKAGILFLLNFWGAGNQGDHIDLWNGSRMTRGTPEYFHAAQEVWFWEVA